MNYWVNLAIIILILAVVVLAIGIWLMQQKKDYVEIDEEDQKARYEYKPVLEFLKKRMQEITNANIFAQTINSKEDLEREERRIEELKTALADCNTGDLSSKIYIREFLFGLLLNEYEYNEENINWTIPFNKPQQMSGREKFETLLYWYTKKHGHKALSVMIEEYKLTDPKEDGTYSIEEHEISEIYKQKIKHNTLSFEDKLHIVTQIIYSQYKGFGVIDELREMSIDGVSGGVSGIPPKMKSYQSDEEILKKYTRKNTKGSICVWFMYKAKTIRVPFLVFENEAEIRRVINNIYKYGYPGQMSEDRPYILNEMADGSRTIVFRPKLTEAWSFFIRKKYDGELLTIKELYPQKNNEFLEELLSFLMKGNRNCALTGGTGVGKTTLLTAMVSFIKPTYLLRVQEQKHELGLRAIYPNRNILSFQETDSVSGQDGMDLIKKTDGDVTIVGEISTAPVASWVVQSSQVASKMALFSHHAKTLAALVKDFRNALLAKDFSNENSAEQQVVEVLDFDIHGEVLEGEKEEERYIERISECVPIEYDDETVSMDSFKNALTKEEKMDAVLGLASAFFSQKIQRKQFIENKIMEFRNGEYVPLNPISKKRQDEMMKSMTPKDRQAFQQFLKKYWG